MNISSVNREWYPVRYDPPCRYLSRVVGCRMSHPPLYYRVLPTCYCPSERFLFVSTSGPFPDFLVSTGSDTQLVPSEGPPLMFPTHLLVTLPFSPLLVESVSLDTQVSGLSFFLSSRTPYFPRITPTCPLPLPPPRSSRYDSPTTKI